ncbi:MAG: hypothetical protein AAFR46_15495 [Pseudomonadota bacterium]
MEIEKILSSIFRVAENEHGSFDVAFDVAAEGGTKTIRLTLVSDDRHAADTMAHMFNRVVNGVRVE